MVIEMDFLKGATEKAGIIRTGRKSKLTRRLFLKVAMVFKFKFHMTRVTGLGNRD
jgi:hypothetical protein